ncbi:MAG: glycosyltransferase family 9 protein [Candidatus Omnitrophota bacterium]
MVRESEIKKILFITLTNIGDVAFTLSSLDYLKDKFKDANFTVLSGPNASILFSYDSRIKENISYNKHVPFREKFALFNRLRKENFDVIIDLRDTVFRWVVKAKYINPRIISIPKNIVHLKLRHLYKTLAAFKETKRIKEVRISPLSLCLDKNNIESSENFIKKQGLSFNTDYIVVAPGARSHTKRWLKKGFTRVCHELLKHYPIVLIGDKSDSKITQDINKHLSGRCVDLAGQTSLLEAIAILKNSKLTICNDSAVLHISSYLNKPILAIFGPTDENGSGPTSDICAVARKNAICTPCLSDNCKNNWVCMLDITPQLVNEYAQALLNGKIPKPQMQYRRVLISRTDRLGDVLLSTPVIKNLRKNLPGAHIAVMVKESLLDLLKGNPYLDEVIAFDKIGKHKGLIDSIRFTRKIRKKNFDLALILHPTIRVHLILFFAGIKERIGYDKKWGFLNTRIIKHTKQLGQKHESEYTLDFLKKLGLVSFDKTMFMPIYKESEEWADGFLKERNLYSSKIVLIHAQASCPSRLWPQDYYNSVVDNLISIYNANVIYIGELRKENIKENNNIFNLTGKTTISQLASIIKHSNLLISNDSGPVHIAVALGTPVISIFGRKQTGLSPRRWGHSNAKSVFLHKDVGCEVCLAHDCNKDFVCLKAIEPGEVLTYVAKFLS